MGLKFWASFFSAGKTGSSLEIDAGKRLVLFSRACGWSRLRAWRDTGVDLEVSVLAIRLCWEYVFHPGTVCSVNWETRVAYCRISGQNNFPAWKMFVVDGLT